MHINSKVIAYTLIVGVMIVVSLMAVEMYTNEKFSDVKYCDSQNIQSGYTGENICYEKPIISTQTKLIVLDK